MDRNEKYCIKNARERSNLCPSRIFILLESQNYRKEFEYSVLNVSELIRRLTHARNLKKQCIYM